MPMPKPVRRLDWRIAPTPIGDRERGGDTFQVAIAPAGEPLGPSIEVDAGELVKFAMRILNEVQKYHEITIKETP